MTIFEKLSAPFSPDQVSWRVGSTNKEKTRGMALAYLDARDVMERLDDILGPQGWQCRYPHTTTKTVCEIGIKHGDEWIWKADGAGDSDIEAEKGALSDAFKRAAVRWGIGRYLYHVSSPWVELDKKGNSYVIKDTEYAKLANLLKREGGLPIPAASPEPGRQQVQSIDMVALAQDGRAAAEKGSIVLREWWIGLPLSVRAMPEVAALKDRTLKPVATKADGPVSTLAAG